MGENKNNQDPIVKQDDRLIYCNKMDEHFKDNSISTSKYTCLTFLPKNLVEQFSKMANMYFLLIGIMQIIDDISISEGVPVIYLPLALVIAISALKDLFEDLKRHKQDNEENMRLVSAYRNVKGKWDWTPVHWKDIRVGELVKIIEDEYLPCDILVLQSSDDQGYAFIETKNLDGETNLKRKLAPKDTQGMDFDNLQDSQPFTFKCEPPNPYLYTFKGTLTLKNQGGNEKNISDLTSSLSNDNFILRGSSLRNTRHCIGLVSYSGHETKIMLNSVKAKPKKSKVERQMNSFIIGIFITQLIVCFLTSIVSVYWYQSKDSNNEISYLEFDSNDTKNKWYSQLFIKWGTWILIFTNFVPISLLVTVEMVKFAQGIFISLDKHCKTTVEPIVATTVQASNLNEELGQVEYIFSDKTGTLTANVMKYKVYSVNGVSYGDNEATQDKSRFSKQPQVTNVDFWDYSLLDDIEKDFQTLEKNQAFSKPFSQRLSLNVKAYEAMIFLGLCHTIIADQKEDKDGNPYLQYNASSPDELALINFAKFMGFEYLGSDKQQVMTIKFRGYEEKFKLLHVLEFDSTRKRQSVLIKHIQGGQESEDTMLYTKGADSVIDKLLKPEYKQEGTAQNKLHTETFAHLEKYSLIGLRTLLCAKRIIGKSEFEQWNIEYKAANELLEGREEAVDKLQTQIEQQLDIIGGTAIEDQLQDKVGETIFSLKEAGIKVWVLTGDKIETAVNIGYSCKLLDDSLYQLRIDGTTPEKVMETLKTAHENISNPLQLKRQLSKEGHKTEGEVQFALLMTGDSLIHAMKDENMQRDIMSIAHQCKAVMCCRVSPKQKAEVVFMVRHNLPDMISLAIGDGANDVNMITAAHVGIGIRGVEGQQAARASDFAIGEFKILKELLLNHGRESYRKNSALIGYNFYKNMILVLPQWWYAFCNGFSGASNYDPYIYQLYNMFYTALPIIIYGLFDVEFSRNELMKQPKYYIVGLKSKLFNKKEFFLWIFFGVWQAALCGWFAYLSMEFTFVKDGRNNNFNSSGMVSFHNSVVVGNLKVLLFSYCYTAAHIITIFGSIAFFILNHYIGSGLQDTDMYASFEQTYVQNGFYFQNILLIGACIFVDLAFGRYRQFIQNLEYREAIYSSNKVSPQGQEQDRHNNTEVPFTQIQ